eukprot:jgi/Mesvir1/13081/Mv06065-RA.1
MGLGWAIPAASVILVILQGLATPANACPIARCKADDVVVALDHTGAATLAAFMLNDGSLPATSEKCSSPVTKLQVSREDFGCTDRGVVDVTLTVTDSKGAKSSCTGLVRVEDNIQPVAKCRSELNVVLNSTGQYSLHPSELDDGSYDRCGIAQLGIKLSSKDYSCEDVGREPVEVQIYVLDVNDNIQTCASPTKVIVTAPEGVCPPPVADSSSLWFRP